MKKAVLERFLRYVAVDTQSVHDSETYPSSLKQLVLARMLTEELKELGIKDVNIDEYGYVTAKIPANVTRDIPAIGFIAHYDTAADFSGENVRPKITENYDGNDIYLDYENNIVLSPADFPELKGYVGQTLITTDGSTLLGADDKAGIAEIMTAVDYLLKHPEIEHGPLCIGFTPDEEVGCGTKYFDVEKFGAKYAYTVDGGELGSIEFENFNGAGAKITIKGRNVHPGSAKQKMINSVIVGIELCDMLPAFDRPVNTQDYEGFFHVTDFNGTVEETVIDIIIRDHDRDLFEQKKEYLRKTVEFIAQKYPKAEINLDLKDSYFNMREKIEPVYHIVETAQQAMRDLDIVPITVPIRGGTDGARLSFMGLPCPNLFTGGHNYHGRFEFVVLDSMEKSVQVVLQIIKAYGTGK